MLGAWEVSTIGETAPGIMATIAPRWADTDNQHYQLWTLVIGRNFADIDTQMGIGRPELVTPNRMEQDILVADRKRVELFQRVVAG
jgi:hypothetical protein